MRSQKDPRGKFSRWITELEEYSYTVKYLPGSENVKADPLSRNKAAGLTQPQSKLEEKIYSVRHSISTLVSKSTFLDQLKSDQDADPVISNSKRTIA